MSGARADPLLAYQRGARQMSERIRSLERENARLRQALLDAAGRIAALEMQARTP